MTDVHPTVDVLTDQVAVVIQERRVVPFTSWLADAVRVCGRSGRGLQIVTPADARLTLPLRSVLGVPPYRWVIRSGDGYYDGLTGAVLTWDGRSFTAVRDESGAGTLAAAFTAAPEALGTHLTLTVRMRHPPTVDTVVGGAVERLYQALTGASPGGWGTAEPASQLWNRGELTEFCRERAPEPTWTVLVGGSATGGARPALGTLLVSRTQGGVEESAQVVIGYLPGEEPPLEKVRALAAELAGDYSLLSLFAQLGAGAADLTVVPRWTGIPGPTGMALGTAGLRSTGTERAYSPPNLVAHRIGTERAPAVWYDFGDGRSPESLQRFDGLMRHLGFAPGRPPATGA